MEYNKFLRYVLTVFLVLTIAGESVHAEETVTVPKAWKRTFQEETAQASELQNPIHHCDTVNQYAKDYSDFSYVYFGSYPQTEITDSAVISEIDKKHLATGDVWINGVKYRKISSVDTNHTRFFNENTSDYRYFKWERIRWKVLYTDRSKALVVAADGLDCQEYHEEEEDVTWENCSLRKWLNGYDGFADLDRNNGTSFTAIDFYDAAFDSSEQEAIIPAYLSNATNTEYNTPGGKDTKDNIFLLSLDDIRNTSYGFCGEYDCFSASRWVKATDYSHAMGINTITNDKSTGGNRNCWWWLRSPGASADNASWCYTGGSIRRDGNSVTTYDLAVVPALYLNLNSAEWYTTDDGTSIALSK